MTGPKRQEEDQAVKVRSGRDGKGDHGVRSGNKLAKIKRKWDRLEGKHTIMERAALPRITASR